MNSFVSVITIRDRKGTTHVCPEFSSHGKDIMMKGGKFYAIYDESTGLWSTDQGRAIDIIDDKLIQYANEHYPNASLSDVVVDHLYRSSTKQLKAFKEWMSALPTNHNYHQLDNEITQLDMKTTLKDYRSKKLMYRIESGPTDNYDLFMNTCYSPEEREKLEWAVGSVLNGDSAKIQKFIAIYGRPGTGKSTFFKIVQKLFEGYWGTIDVDSLVSKNNQFATSVLKDNPLVCIQHDADLSRIEKNDVLNSIVSHEEIYLNEKYKEQYVIKLNAMIFIGTNETVNINDTRQGITRRMIDVYPTGDTLPQDVYNEVINGIDFELAAIAAHCIDVYCSVPKNKYLKYRPTTMIQKTNVYTNFVSDRYFDLCEPANDPITVKDLYKMFKLYMEESGYTYVPTIAKFKEIMLDFYSEFKERERINGKQMRSVFIGFKKDCIDGNMSCVNSDEQKDAKPITRFVLEDHTADIANNPLQKALAKCQAQYSNKHGVPAKSWDKSLITMENINPLREHYVKCPANLICIDFDLKDDKGEKNYELNLAAIQKWPPTYAETSKGGAGIHLHYWYDGDPLMLSRIYDENIEVKVFTGNAALRRRLSLSNMLPIAHISSGLPLREEPKVVSEVTLQNEKALRTVILKNLNKEYHPATKPSIDFIYKVLDDAYKSGMHYDVSDLENRITAFANNSSHNARYCLGVVSKMSFKSDDISEAVEPEKDTLIFVDIECFKNVFMVCWMEDRDDAPMNTLINPRPFEVEAIFKYKIVGFNCRAYDNHMLYAKSMGYTNEGLYELSRRLIDGDTKARIQASFSEAYNLSYADVYDFAKKKQSLKAWEIELGIRHLENQYPWDEPLPEDKWTEVAEYCGNDVRATRALFHHLKADFIAREMIAEVTGLTVNHTTRQHATKLIFGDDKHPELVYTNLAETFPGYRYDKNGIDKSEYNGYDPENPKTWHTGFSIYRGEDPSEGGKVLAVPGIWFNVGLLDIASMHPSTIIALNYFGKYTARFKELVDTRIAIKHGDFEFARKAFNGKFANLLTDETVAAQLADALKIIINSVYGFTTATFENVFRDSRNVDNIVAKRGALFMILLKDTLEEKGIPWIHVKTDSIKIPNITPEIVAFVQEFGRKYGYEFELESVYEKMCLINGSTYVAYVKSGKHAGEWVTVAAQFQHPYVKKTLFTKEPLTYQDFCEVKSVTTSMVLDYNENLPEGEHCYEFVGKIGSYVPVKAGCNGGELLRDNGAQYKKAYAAWLENPFDKNGKPKPEPNRYASVVGTVGYRWLDSEVLKGTDESHWKSKLDMSYYNKLADEAIAAINKYGNYDEFINYKSEDYPPDEESPY